MGTHSVVIHRDTVPPAAVSFSAATTASPTGNSRLTWTWATGGNGRGLFRYVLDNGAAVETTGTSFTPPAPLADGPHTLSVRELDSAGNWSATTVSDILITEGPVSFYVMHNQDYVDRGPNRNNLFQTDSGLFSGTAPIPMGNKWSILFSIRFSFSSKGQSNVNIIRTPEVNITWTYPNCACPVNINAAVTAFVPLRGSNQTVNVSTGGPSSTWMNIAVTYDGSQVKIYNGGTAGLTADMVGTMTGALTHTKFGGATVYGNYRFFNRALATAEIAVFSKDPEFGFQF